jgi:outer membrane receptor protein involved in Fe transport
MYFFSPSHTGITLLLLTLSSAALGQVTTVTGQVKDGSNRSVSFANVLLMQAQDSALYKGTLTDEAGSFTFENVGAGTFRVKSFMIGYTPLITPPFTIAPGQQSHRLPPLELSVEARQLSEVRVEAQKPLYEQQIDRLVVNVQNSITAAGSTALEVLERSPGITLDRQNNALLMAGKQGVQVMINGKLSRLPISAIIQMLEGMNASNIEKIELITTPSAKYDAEGNAGMINIVLKKNTDFGTNGSFALTMGYGRYEKPAANLNLNHRTQKLNLYGDYSFAYNHGWMQFTNSRFVNHLGVPSSISTVSDRPFTRTSHNPRVGFDYTLGPKTTIGAVVSGFSNKWEMDARNKITLLEGQKLPTLIDLQTIETNVWRHLMSNLNLKHSLKENQEITLDLDYLLYHNRNPSSYENNYRFLENQETAHDLIRIEKTTPIRMGVAKADYLLTLNSKTKVETGIKGTLTRLDNEVVVDRYLQNQWQRDPEFSQKIDMQEDIMAGYANVNFELNPRTKVQTGLRYEHTYTDLSSPTQKHLVLRRYGNFFPSLFLTRELSKDHNLQFSYSRRITRPTFNDLAPFVLFLDPYTFFSGNTALRPAITDAVQGTYQFKKIYLLSLQYSHDDNAIGWLVRVNPETNNQTFYIGNVDRTNTLSLNLSLPFTVASWWQMQNNLTGFLQETNTLYEGTKIKLAGTYARVNSTQSFKLPENFSLELSGFYQSPGLYGITRMKSFGSLNAGLQKKLKEERGMFNLSVNDVFWTNRIGIITDQPAVNLNQSFGILFEPRVVRLTYSRNFGNKTLKAINRRKTGSEEERRRVSSGN